MSWEERLQELEDKKAQGLRLVKAAAFEDGKLKLEQAREILEKYYVTQLDVIGRGIEEAKTRIVEKQRTLGDKEWADGNLEMAKEHYSVCLNLAESRVEKDEILIKLGQIEQKATPSDNLERLAAKVQAEPENAEALYNFASELAMERYLPEAISHFQRLTKLTPEDADVYYRLGNALLDTLRLDEATEAYQKALDLNFEDKAEVYYRLGCVEMEGQANHLEAKKQFKKGLECRDDHVEILKKMAHLNKLEENYEQAIEYLQLVMKYEADDATTCSELGDLFETQGKQAEAQNYWAKAIELEPDGDAAEYAREKLTQLETEAESARDITPE
jgi:tetratricopeptide (TPR) repeat protein